MTGYDIVVIGAGISGATLAERYASLGKKVLVLEKRDHIGGNCYDFYNSDGILVSKYGAHLFHTNDETVWKYVNRFSQWYPYEHRVLAKVDGKLVPLPINITTVNTLFHLNLKNEKDMQQWLEKNQLPYPHPKNSEEAALSRVGKVLYKKIFQNYTRKQWDKDPSELDAAVLSRIPVSVSFENRYFHDKYQYLPVGGYTQLFEKMLSHPLITVRLNTDYFDVQDELGSYQKLFFTGPIDRFFEFKHNQQHHLEYRSLRFVWETHDQEFYQKNAVINYPSPKDGAFTRITEYKHLTKQKHPKTTISKEYPTAYKEGENEPFYPVPSPQNQAVYKKYQQEAAKLTDVYFVGRLANYKYFNMDEAFKNALDLFQKLESPKNETSHS